MIAISEIVPESRVYDFWTSLFKTNFDDCSHIWSVFERIAIMVRFGFVIAIVFSPFRDQYCNHIWSLLRLRLQLYLVPIGKIVAIICGPALYKFILIILMSLIIGIY